ncbi:MAG: MurR/RpiR family transcriptional regulator [Pseudomonadota bacterium]
MILQQVAEQLPNLSRAERQVAEHVLSDPEACPNLTIAELANAARVSEPTVVRFCRSMQCDGYLAFKMRVAQDIATRVPVRAKVVPGDSSSAIAHSVVRSVHARLHTLLQELQEADLDRAMALLDEANRIEVYGMGGSGNVAREAQLRLLRLGKPVVCHTDPHVHAAAAALLTPDTTVLAISNSGRNRDLIASVELARGCGARVVAITPAETPMAALACALCSVSPSDGKELLMPVSSRVAQLAVVDILAVGLAMRDTAQRTQLGRANAALDGKYLQ